MELLHTEIKKLRGKLNDQISLFEHLLQTEDVETVKSEIRKGSQIILDLRANVSEYINVCSQDESADPTDIVNMMNAEDDSFSKVEKAVNEWIEEKISERRQPMVNVPNSYENSCVDVKKMEDKGERSNMRTTVNLMRVQLKLDNQIRLFDDLLNSRDEWMIKRKLERLLEIFKEMKSMSTSFGENLCEEEYEKMRDIVSNAEIQVQKTRTLANGILFMIREEEGSTVISQRSRLSNVSKGVSKWKNDIECNSLIKYCNVPRVFRATEEILELP